MLIDVLIPIVYIEKYLNYGDIFSKEKKNTANLPRTEYNQYVMTKIDTKFIRFKNLLIIDIACENKNY